MTPDRWQQISRLFNEALTRDPESRGAFLAAACIGDEDLRRELESLLEANTQGQALAPSGVALAGLVSERSLIDRQVGSYRVTARLGVGGMGEVYRAHDARLRRDVAIKVLPQSFTADEERLARFTREARLLAALNHPNIGAIYGIEESADIRALVLELVDGETLAERLVRSTTRSLTLAETLEIAKQIAGALDAAHDKGIVHRDLKPANVKITSAGVVKVLDFGLGKATAADGGSNDQSAASTIGDTREGVILGTPSYMSPEQARGIAVDKRSDVWAFGCVLYEMLAGRRAFEGEDVADTLARVLQREADLSALPQSTPASVRRLLARCLEKDRNKRLPHIAVVAFQIDEALASISSGTVEAVRSPSAIRHLLPTLVAGAVLGAAAIWLLSLRTPVATVPVTRLQMSVSPADEIGGATAGRPTRTAFALSPDGRRLVFSAVQKGQRALYVRPLDQSMATVIPDTTDAVAPFFSPDGQWVGYWAAGQLRKVPLAGGPSVLVAASQQLFGVSWGDDGRIVFARITGGLFEVSSAGGMPSQLTTLNSQRSEVSHRLPDVLPGGDAVLFTVTRSRFPRWDETQVWVYSRRSGASTLLVDGGADARYVSSGHLLYVREGALLAVPFDVKRLAVTGGPLGVVSDVMQAAYLAGLPNDTGAMQVSVSTTGTLAYVAGGIHPPAEYTVLQLDRTGRGEPLPIPPHEFRTMHLSPDGTSLALATVGRDRGVWIYSFARGTFGKLIAAGRSLAPIWNRDGQRIAYGTGTSGNNLQWTRADGGGSSEVLVTGPLNLVPAGWTPGDRHLFYYSIQSDAVGRPTVWIQDRVEKSAPSAIYDGIPGLGGLDVSPDGRWVAYHSEESGRLEVYVDAFPRPGPRFQVSTTGGGSPVWRADGRELFYARPTTEGQARGTGESDVEVMAVTVTTQPSLTFGPPRGLFSGRYSMNNPDRGYDVSGDGERFLMLQARPRRSDVITELTIVQNWTAELARGK